MKNIDMPMSKLFLGIAPDEIQGILKCLSAVHKKYEKNDYIFRMGELTSSVGFVICGSVQIIQEDFWGERRIMGEAAEGQLFGEAYACIPNEPLMVSVIAAEKSEVLLLDMNHVITTCSSACVFHSRLIYNLLSILADKNLMLTRKIDHMGKKSIREKVLSYLSFQSSRQRSRTFEIPFNRQQLADYLAVDRSALSAELSKMQKENIIRYHRSQFTLL